jgi:hypothetical protein
LSLMYCRVGSDGKVTTLGKANSHSFGRRVARLFHLFRSGSRESTEGYEAFLDTPAAAHRGFCGMHIVIGFRQRRDHWPVRSFKPDGESRLSPGNPDRHANGAHTPRLFSYSCQQQ